MGHRIALLAACFLWAISFIATKVAIAEVPPLTVVTFRLLISAICFVLWMKVKRRELLSLFRAHGWDLLKLSIFGTSLHYGVQTVGLQFTTASNASVFAVTGPLTIAVIAVFVLGEGLTWRKSVGIGVALIGVFCVMGMKTLSRFDFGGHILGDSLVLISIVMWGIFTVMGKSLTDKLPPLEVTSGLTLIGALSMIPVGIGEMWYTHYSIQAITVKACAAIGFLGIGCSFLAVLFYFYALSRTDSQTVGVYLYTIPPMTAVTAALLLDESITAGLTVGTILVIGGVYLTEQGKSAPILDPDFN